jgi:hypothetical protein
MVYVEARIDINRSSNYVIPHITARCRVIGCCKLAGGRERESFLHERKVAAFFRPLVNGLHEGVVQCKDIRVVVQGRHGRYCQSLA